MSAGWTKEQTARWPRVVGLLEETYTPPQKEAMTEDLLASLATQLAGVEREVTPSEVERKQRRGIVTHLTRTLERQVRGSKLHPFGSAETGLVLRRGDVDLCLVVKDLRKPKGVLRHLANVLELSLIHI
mgnify:CR=1 FL=1